MRSGGSLVCWREPKRRETGQRRILWVIREMGMKRNELFRLHGRYRHEGGE